MKIAIAGYGAEGQSNYVYYSRLGHEVTIVDERRDIDTIPDGALTLLGDGVFNRLDGYDLVVRTAGLSPSKIITTGKVWSSTNEFFAKCPARIIGVTGTKGKGTTSSLVTSMLRAAGKTVHLVGNIGVPSLDILPSITADDIVVFELSSFQLWDLKRSPHVSVVLMIEPDHLNVHASFDDYVEAKAAIRRYQTAEDVCIYHPTNRYSRKIALSARGERNTRRYAVSDDQAVYVKANKFFVQDVPICPLDALQLPGVHNQENACAAMSAALCFTDDYDAIESGLREFEGLPHRLEFIREVEGVKFYNDSFSSAPGATIAAVRSFDAPEIVILGGTDKGADFSGLAEALRQQSNVKQLIIIGEIREQLGQFLRSHGVGTSIDTNDAKTMSEVVNAARSYARADDVVILSPACASFDMFNNFYDRGDQFRIVVSNL